MNDILEVKLRFNHERNNPNFGVKKLRKNKEVSEEKIDEIINSLKAILTYYNKRQKVISGLLIDANYNDIVAKSNRIKEILKPIGGTTDGCVVGARFSDAPVGEENHIITYYVDEQSVIRTIEKLELAKRFVDEQLGGNATTNNFNELAEELNYEPYGPKNVIRGIVVDCSAIESFSVPEIKEEEYKETLLLTLFKTEKNTYDVIQEIGLGDTVPGYYPYGDNTISVSWDFYKKLEDKIPYLISMISKDFSKISYNDIEEISDSENEMNIPSPTIEPTIGVIDNLFDESVYFHDWVSNYDYLDEFETINGETIKNHGTQVTSIVVDGPSLNPWLDDKCGRFKVKHFGVCEEKISIPRLMRKIKDIVNENPDIHVWNLSLGTEDEISRNFISYDAAVLDELQAEKNIIFVISGTNDNREERDDQIRLGSPADSLNSLVVNSVRKDDTSASYSRKGNVLSFYNKPDVSYYGGDYTYGEKIIAYSSTGKTLVYGTSFAAPWISRKMCYLIDVVGLSREVAKALIIDSAAGWRYKQETYKQQHVIGYGVVPIDITEILSTKDDEIRFVLYGTAESYKTTNYAIPIPRDNEGKYPYVARATLCYFPKCSRFQGVDYTSRELSIQFGRVKSNDKIDDINDNVQDVTGYYTDERKSRKEYRKWENTKLISKIVKNNKALKSYGDRLWGISIVSKERLGERLNTNLNFGVVITLKEINGVNRIQDFIHACNLRGWIVNEINNTYKYDIYVSNQEEITLE